MLDINTSTTTWKQGSSNNEFYMMSLRSPRTRDPGDCVDAIHSFCAEKKNDSSEQSILFFHLPLSGLSFILITYWRTMVSTKSTETGCTDGRTSNGLYIKPSFVFEVTSFYQTFSLFPLSSTHRVQRWTMSSVSLWITHLPSRVFR